MTKIISILGCGWLGLPLAIALIRNKHLIKGSATSENKLETLNLYGINSYLIDIEKNLDRSSEFFETEILIVCLPPNKVENYEKLIHQIKGSEIKKVIFMSATSVYPLSNQIVTETSPTRQSPLVDFENLFKTNKNFDTTILRFGGLFGYDREPGRFIRKGQKIKNPEGYVNLIHRDDCIQIIDRIIANEVWGETFNACADAHPKRKEFYTNEILKIGGDVPELDLDSKNQYKIVSSEKLKKVLNFSFKYSDLLKD